MILRPRAYWDLEDASILVQLKTGRTGDAIFGERQ